jgi:hypothetical protein
MWGLFNLQALLDKSDKAEPDLLEQYNPLVLLNSEREFCLTPPVVQNFAHRDAAHIRFSTARCLLLANSLYRLCCLSKAGESESRERAVP